MMLGKVVGEVWSTRKHAGLAGRKLLLVASMARTDDRFLPTGEIVVAVDQIGAQKGQMVTVSWGSGARAVLSAPDNRHILVDAAVSRIVDAMSLDELGTVLDIQHPEE